MIPNLRKKNKKGLAGNIMLLIVFGIVLVFIILLIYAGSLILPILTPNLQEMGTLANDAMQSTNNQDIQYASNNSIVPATESLNNMEWIGYTMMIFMFLVFIVMCFYIRVYPFLMWIWIVLIVILVFVSMYMTVAYQDLRADSQLGDYYKAWGNTDFVLRNLPVVVFILGVIGGIVMFMVSSRDGAMEQGGGYL